MATYGLGNFVYNLEVRDGNVKFHFYDPDDAENTADVTVSSSDFPEGITQPDSRQVADYAYSQCSKVLNDKRDARVKRTAQKELEDKIDGEAAAREAADDFNRNSQELANTTPTGGQPAKAEDKPAPAHENTSQPSDSSKDAKKGK